SEDIPRLVEPILAGRADMVVGDRQVGTGEHFSPTKKLLQRLRERVVLRGGLLAGRADMVVGDRQVRTVEHFSPTKKLLQRLGSWVVRRASNTDVLDTTSGFRAYNREAALQLIVVSRYTYTLESLIQAGKMSVALEDVAISTNPTDRESRLVGSASSYVRRKAFAVFRAYTLYEPLVVFMIPALLFGALALAAWSPFLLDWILNGDRSGHIQSLILGAVLML